MKKSLGSKTIAFRAPTRLVGTYDKMNRANMMTAAWGGICNSDPASIAVSLRKATYSYEFIVERKAFTVNIPSEEFLKQADYMGLVSGKDTNKIEDCGMTAIKSELVDAPYLEECPIILECKLLHTHDLGLHTQFIGQIMDVKADLFTLNENGKPTMDKVQPILFDAGSRGYYGVGKRIGEAFSVGKEL